MWRSKSNKGVAAPPSGRPATLFGWSRNAQEVAELSWLPKWTSATTLQPWNNLVRTFWKGPAHPDHMLQMWSVTWSHRTHKDRIETKSQPCQLSSNRIWKGAENRARQTPKSATATALQQPRVSQIESNVLWGGWLPLQGKRVWQLSALGAALSLLGQDFSRPWLNDDVISICIIIKYQSHQGWTAGHIKLLNTPTFQ